MIIAALFLLSCRIAHVYKKNILDCLAVASAGLLMVMYLLAFFRGLKLTGVVGAAVIVYVLARTFLDGRSSSLGKELSALGKSLLEPVVICFVLCILAVGFASSDQVFTWWDDINYWSSDAKQLL